MTHRSDDTASGARPAWGTIIECFEARLRSSPRAPAFVDRGAPGEPLTQTWEEHARQVRSLAVGLRTLGIGRGQRVAIWAPTSLDWERFQMAALYCGGSVVGLDMHYPPDLVGRLTRSLGVAALVVQDASTLDKLPAAARESIRHVIAMQGPRPPGTTSPAQVIDRPAAGSLHPVAPEDEALVAFSSGTTGDPRPVTYRHEQVMAAVQAILQSFADIQEGSPLLCWLPLAQLFQRMVNFGAMARGAVSHLVPDPRAVMEHVGAVNPVVIVGVPRFFQQVHAGVQARLRDGPAWLQRLAEAAIRAGHRRVAARRAGRTLPAHQNLTWWLADRLVLRRLRGAFGHGLRYAISGSAAMPPWLIDWFDAIGVPVLEAYGTSECIVPIACNTIDARKPGTVGRPLRSNQVHLATDGEIVVRGPGVADEAGVLATGDLGQLDADGFLRIVGRKSEVFKIGNGRWLAPAPLEDRLRALQGVDHALVLGAGRPAPAAIVGMACKGAAEGWSESELRALQALLREAMQGLPRHEQVAGVLVAPSRAFSIAGGELTTNLKLRRRHVEQKFADSLQRLYHAIDAGTDMPVVNVHALGGNP